MRRKRLLTGQIVSRSCAVGEIPGMHSFMVNVS
jgi:hypothetical protein